MSNKSEIFTLLKFFEVWASRKKAICLTILIPTATSVMVVLLLKSTYQSDALVKPPTSEGSSPIESVLKGTGAGIGGALSSFLGNSDAAENDCMSILKSARFAGLVIDRFDLLKTYKFTRKKKYYMADVIKRFERNANFDLTDDDEIKMSMKDRSPEKAQEMVSYMIHTLDSLYTDLQRTANRRSLRYVDQRLSLAEFDMKVMEDSMVNFQNIHNLIVPETQVKLILENATQTEIEIETIREEMSLEAALRGTLSARYKDLAIQKGLLEETLQGQLRSPSDSNELILPARELPALATQYFRLERAYDIKLAIYKFLVEQAEALKLEANKNVQVISVLDPPWVNDKRVSPKRTITVGVVFAISFILALIVPILIDAWERHQKENPESREMVAEIKRNLLKF